VLCIDWNGSNSPDPGDEQSGIGRRPVSAAKPAATALDAA